MLPFLIVCNLIVVGLVGRICWVRARVTFTERLLSDREFGLPMLEALASRWGAKLEMFQLPGPPR